MRQPAPGTLIKFNHRDEPRFAYRETSDVDFWIVTRHGGFLDWEEMRDVYPAIRLNQWEVIQHLDLTPGQMNSGPM